MPLTNPPAALRRNTSFRLFWYTAPWIVAALLALLSPAAHAQQCHVNGAFGMDFGTVGSAGKGVASSVQYACQNHTAAPTLYFELCLYLGPGQYSSGQPTRRMINHSNGTYLGYDLFSDLAHTQKIGAPGTTPVYRLSMQVSQGRQDPDSASIYGWVYPNQAVPAGDFQEQNIPGTLRYRYGSTPFSSADCTTGGENGSSVPFNSSGVRARLDNSCQITVIANDLDFGQVPPPGTAITATSNIAVNCPVQTPWSIGLNNGLHYSAGWRRMADATGRYITYQIYRDPSHSQIWGDTLGTRYNHTTPANGNTVNVTTYGLVPAQLNAAPGSYSDTITVTLTY